MLVRQRKVRPIKEHIPLIRLFSPALVPGLAEMKQVLHKAKDMLNLYANGWFRFYSWNGEWGQSLEGTARSSLPVMRKIMEAKARNVLKHLAFLFDRLDHWVNVSANCIDYPVHEVSKKVVPVSMEHASGIFHRLKTAAPHPWIETPEGDLIPDGFLAGIEG